jgi:hypothetical protein
MAENAKTGNAFLDTWMETLATFAPTGEGLFFANGQARPNSGFERWAGVAASLAEPWSTLTQRTFGMMTAMGSLANAGDPLGKALEQSFGVLGDVGGAGAQVPAALAEAGAVASRLFAAREAYQAFMTATWQRAYEEVVREAMRLTAKSAAPTTPAQWLALSTSVSDRIFVEAFNSAAYLEAQRRLSDALADQRRSEMKLVEIFAQFGHFPTRGALDAVGAEVSELRRRVRRLERALRELRATDAPEAESADAG